MKPGDLCMALRVRWVERSVRMPICRCLLVWSCKARKPLHVTDHLSEPLRDAQIRGPTAMAIIFLYGGCFD